MTNEKIPRPSAKAAVRIMFNWILDVASGWRAIASTAREPIRPIARAGMETPIPMAIAAAMVFICLLLRDMTY